MTLTLDKHGYRLRIAPRHGAAILSADWTTPGRPSVPLLAPLADAAGLRAGCFVMAPFANRINRGRFAFRGQRFRLPINLPEEDMAIHGFSRDRPWEVTLQTPDEVHLQQDFADDGNPYRYRAAQEIRLSPGTIRIHLAVRNDGSEAMPFGIGLHPWFAKTARATLSLDAAGVHGRDARGLPVAPLAAVPHFTPAAPARLGQLARFDNCLAGWWPRTAFIAWPEHWTGLRLAAEGAFRHLHVFVPDDRPVFCAEPVSHFPDAVNRPELGPEGAMDVLQPGETLTGATTLAAVALAAEPNPNEVQE
ncbi:aldose 1-epimerase [Pseudochelatococcus sp. B33]